MMSAISRHRAFDHMARHRHRDGYVALVLAGSYLEAGDRGRFRVEAGQVLIHGAHESHQNAFFGLGAQVLNLPSVGAALDAGVGQIDDPDAIARLAERDLRAATEMLHATFRPSAARLEDWPDRLAASLATEPDFNLAQWAEAMDIAPQSLSRGFRCAYGTSPKRYRLELRALRALRRLPGWHGSIASLAADAGFADQAHLTRAIVAITGQTPGRLKG